MPDNHIVTAIDSMVARLPNDALAHLLSSVIFECARRDKATPRQILDVAFKVAPTDAEYHELLPHE